MMRISGGAKSIAQGAASTTEMTDAILAKLGVGAVEKAYAVSSQQLALTRDGEAGRAGSDVRSDLHVAFEERSSGGIRDRAALARRAVLRRAHPAAGRRRAARARRRARPSRRSSMKARCRLSSQRASKRRCGAPDVHADKRGTAGSGSAARRRRLATACGARVSTCPATSRNTSSMPDCTRPTQSSSTSKTRYTTPRKMRPACWFATRCARSISAAPSAWCGSIQLAARTRRSGRNRSAVTRPHPDSESRERRSRSPKWMRDRLQSQSAAASTRPIWLMPILESALGIENAFAIATRLRAHRGLTIGLEDYTADLGVAKTAGGAESLYARMRVVNAAHAARVQAIDSVYGDVATRTACCAGAKPHAPWDSKAWAAFIRIQIEIIHRAFAPTASEIGKGAEDCCRLRRSAGARSGRGQPRLQDDRCSRGAARAEAGGSAPGRWDSCPTPPRQESSMSAMRRNRTGYQCARPPRADRRSTAASRCRIMGVDGAHADRKQGRPADPQQQRLSRERRQARARPRDRAAALRTARRHDHQQPSSSAQWRPRRADRAADRRADGREGSGLVPQRIVPLSRAGDRSDEVGRGAPHRRQHERPAGRLLLARHTCAAWACCARTADAGRRCRMAKSTSTSP